MPSSGLNLLSVNEAFGEKADIYTDVLGIKPTATTDQIQQAYFTRRDELFRTLAKMDQRGVEPNSQKRYQVERQMDGVVMALRVLGDVDARMKYDSIRAARITGRVPSLSRSPGFPGDEEVPLGTGTSVFASAASDGPNRRRLKSALKKTKSLDEQNTSRSSLGELSVTISNTRSVDYAGRNDDNSESTEEGPILAKQSPTRKIRSPDQLSRKSSTSSKSSKGSKLSRKSSASKDELTRSDGSKRKPRKSVQISRDAKQQKNKEDDDASIGSAGTLATTLSVVESRRSMFQVVKEEVMGALDDTSNAFEQVFNVFTLQEDEIGAVFGRIDKAKRQMHDEFTG
mmetsp:Transcript_20359/g.26255  ORF Transcript_20359/g.26255 Transcript_20359/m.26255 type:complete len:342 (-) Transcript_20359:118-1143(-)|eukprot:CAMPEP_0198152454 /NCGR_PEP_ID=MMETSP1443-20131203/59913_1 /TAXON_ID=186043 /ORGANISM="Entomoneis sp., Strain CCMP2396" /LENGTH=341 /DNA_ID=CAMNT_0043818487 /DNA_START=240 /DNA_END=1265 /DNA_ORIENTATION=-